MRINREVFRRLKQCRGGANEIAVLNALAYHDLPNGEIRPHLDALAEVALISARSVMRALDFLEENGFISIVRQRAKGNVYRLLKSDTQSHSKVTHSHIPEAPNVTHSHPECDTQSPDNVTHSHFATYEEAVKEEAVRKSHDLASDDADSRTDPPAASPPPDPPKPPATKSKSKSRPNGQSDACRRVYAAYPKKVEPGDFAKAWRQKSAEIDEADLERRCLDALAWQIPYYGWNDPSSDDYPYRKHPASWLRAEKYDDERPADCVTDEFGDIQRRPQPVRLRSGGKRDPFDGAKEWLSKRKYGQGAEDPLATLRRTLTDLRQVLGPIADRIETLPGRQLRLSLPDEAVDVLEFDR